MNRAYFVARLSKDVEVRPGVSGKSVGTFSIAHDTGYGENKKTSFFNIVAFDKAADNIAKYFRKGDRIALECEPQQNVWEDKEGRKHYDVNFIVRSWEFCETKKEKSDWESIPDIGEEELPFS